MSFKKHLLPITTIVMLALMVSFAMSFGATQVFAAADDGVVTFEEQKFGYKAEDVNALPDFTSGISSVETVTINESGVLSASLEEVGNEHFQALLTAFPSLWDAEKGVTQPVFNLAAANVIHEEVWVEMPIESFATGQKSIAKDQRDLICIRITRPRPADPNYPHTANPANPSGAVKVPVLMVHSPYRGNNQPTVDYNRAVLKNHPNTEYIDNPVTIDGILHTGRPYGVNPDTSHYTYADIKSDRLRIGDWPFDDAAHADPYYHIPASRGAKPIAMASSFSSGAIASGSLSPENYAFTRGFAVVQTSMGGNRYSLSTSSATAGPFNDGLNTYGEAYEMLAGLAAIKWLNGECRAYKTRAATEEVVAYWANGDVAMTGQSYVGTTTMGVASSGHPALKAIIPRAGISNMYEYFRKNGTVYPGDSAQGEDAEWLSRYDMARWSDPNFALGQPDRIAYENIMARIADEIERETGDYNAFWDMGNWLAQAPIYKAAVLFMQGFDDRNVGTKHFDAIYRALKEVDPNYPVKGLLHLQNHTSPFNWGTGDFLGTYHKWLDRFVYGIENGIDTNNIDVWVASNVTGECQTYAQWPAMGDAMYRYYFGPTGTGGGQLFTNAPQAEVEGPFFDELKYRVREDLTDPADPFYNMSVVNDHNTGSTNWWYNLEGWIEGAWESTMLFPTARPLSGFPDDRFAYVNVNKDELLKHTDGRLAYVSEVLTEPVILSGAARVTLDITPDKGIGSISAMIVDLGDARRNYQTSSTVASLQIPAFTNGYNAYNRFQYTFANTITPYKVVARSSVDVQNPNPSGITYLDTAITKDSAFMAPYTYQTVVIEPGKPYSYTFVLEPRHYTFREGNRLAVVIYSTDYKHTIRPYEATNFELTLGENSYIDLPLISQLPAVAAPNFYVSLAPDQTVLGGGEELLVDVMLTGDANYSMFAADIDFDSDFLQYETYTYLTGWVASVLTPETGKVSVRCMPSSNMVLGTSCAADVKIATLKFTVKEGISERISNTALSLSGVVVGGAGNTKGLYTAPVKELPLTIYDTTFSKSFDKNVELYPEWIGTDAQGLPTTMPIFQYGSNYITERVWVEVPCDTDRDGKRDRVSLWIRRPVTKEGFLCPVVMEFSPYHNGTRGYPRMRDYINSEDDHLRALAETFRYHDNYPVSIDINPDTTYLTYDDIKYKGTEAWDPIWWSSDKAFKVNSWYTGVPHGSVPAATVPTGIDVADSITWAPTPGGSAIPARWSHYYVRGYAMVFGQLLGSRDSEGITNTMHMEEWLSAAAAAKWFNGEAKAYKTRDGSVEVKADWASGLVAMDGTSYPGTTPLIAAMTGVKGLKAIMPESCPASQYEYYRSGGGLHCPDGYGGEDINLHSSFNFSRIDADLTASSNNGVIPPAAGPWFDMTAQKAYIETQQYMMREQDRTTGDYNAEWDSRNLTRGYGQIPTDVGILQTSGQQDWNVMPIHAYQMLQAMRDRFSGTHKQVSGLSAHASQSGRLVPGKDGVERGMLKWYLMFLDHFMLGLDNHVDELMYDVNIANNITGVIEGYDYDPAQEERGTIIPGTHFESIYMTPGPAGKAGRLSYAAPTTAVEHFADMDIHGMLTAPLHLGVNGTGGTVNRPANAVGTIDGQGNRMITASTGNWCEDRMIGVNRAYNTTNEAIFNEADKPIDGRLLYLSDPLTERVQLSGAPVLHLQAAPDRGMGTLSVALVEIGRKARGGARTGSSAATVSPTVTVFPLENGASAATASRYANPVGGTTTNFKYVTWGHTDVQNPSYDGKTWFQVPEQNYTPNYFFQTTLIEPGKYYDYVIGLAPSNYTFEVGTRIGIMLYGTDPLYTPLLTPECSAEFDIRLGAGSYLSIPLSKAPALNDTPVLMTLTEELTEIMEEVSEMMELNETTEAIAEEIIIIE